MILLISTQKFGQCPTPLGSMSLICEVERYDDGLLCRLSRIEQINRINNLFVQLQGATFSKINFQLNYYQLKIVLKIK